MINRFNVALIGYGYWGKIISKYLIANNTINLKWICTKSTKPKLPNNLIICSDLSKILDDESVDIIFIITPLSTHFDIAYKALKFNKNVFIEKPATNSFAQTKKLIELSNKIDKKLITDFPYVYSDSINSLRSIISKNKIIHKVEINFSQFGRFDRGDVIDLLGAHALSIIHHLFDLKRIYFKKNKLSKIISKKFPESREFNFTSNKIEFDIKLNLLSPNKTRLMTIYGSENIIQWSPDSEYSVSYCILKNFSKNGVIKHKYDEANSLINVIKYTIDVLRNKTQTNNELSLKVQKSIEQIKKTIIK